MEIGVIRGSTPQVFNAMMFPELSQETKGWIASQFQAGLQSLSESSRAFAERAAALSKQYFTSHAAMAARRIMRELTNIGNNQYLQLVNTAQDVRSANRVSQRYFMANPVLRSLYHRQLCDGYSDTYVDVHPKDIGEDHYDYRRVMNGVVQEEGSVEDGTYRWYVRMYPDDLAEGDRELDPEERHMVLRGWDLIEAMIQAKQDPTDIFGGSLEI